MAAAGRGWLPAMGGTHSARLRWAAPGRAGLRWAARLLDQPVEVGWMACKSHCPRLRRTVWI